MNHGNLGRKKAQWGGGTISCFRQVEGVLILEAAGVLGAMSVVRGSNGLILGA